MTLSEILALDEAGADVFTGHSPADGWKRVYGGLVVSQALIAAYDTVEGRVCHSLHSYFLRAGDPTTPIRYEVERTRDGGAFCARRVVAVQHGKAIFMLMASFQKAEPGHEHQFEMPDEVPPEALVDEMARWIALGDAVPLPARALAASPQRIEMRWSGPPSFEAPLGAPTRKAVWMRAVDAPPKDDIPLQQATLAYASDMTFLGTALAVHGRGFWSNDVQTASLDHTIWFHAPVDFGAWHLFTQETPWTGASRGFVTGRMFDQDGRLVASLAQEGLMRPRGEDYVRKNRF
jgi:acyl-CoA thioesterase-2